MYSINQEKFNIYQKIKLVVINKKLNNTVKVWKWMVWMLKKRKKNRNSKNNFQDLIMWGMIIWREIVVEEEEVLEFYLQMLHHLEILYWQTNYKQTTKNENNNL